MTLPSILNKSVSYVAESEGSALSRYVGFAADFYVRLYHEKPELNGCFQFFRDLQTDDIWSVCTTADVTFGVQLDPDIEVICIWDTQSHEEIGRWVGDAVVYAIALIRQRYLKDA